MHCCDVDYPCRRVVCRQRSVTRLPTDGNKNLQGATVHVTPHQQVCVDAADQHNAAVKYKAEKRHGICSIPDETASAIAIQKRPARLQPAQIVLYIYSLVLLTRAFTTAHRCACITVSP